jgi:murein DD-endopeptidase MepM/ murein hydrolase activator NlpD
VVLTFITSCALVDANDESSRAPEAKIAGCDGQVYASLVDTPYVLPFPVGSKYPMNLGNCSSSYHAEQFPDRYAYDFGMDIGTKVTAARAGTVVRVVEHGIDGDSFVNNLVVVDHGDGTFAEYMHLTTDGALVSVGATVVVGDDVGLSGNTGLAGYPHLHFIVVKDDPSWPYDPVPVSFRNATPNDLVLREGVFYEAR